METNIKRLTLLLNIINVALALIFLSIILSFVYVMPYADKFSKLANNLPQSYKFDGIRIWMNLITYIAISKTVVFRLFFAFVLFTIRKMVQSILIGGVFQEEHSRKIRKIALYFLYFAGILLFFNFIFMLVAFNKGNTNALRTSILNLIVIFENYVLPSIIAFGIAEVLTAGMKLQQEQDLTI